jgi:hypothetical protein
MQASRRRKKEVTGQPVRLQRHWSEDGAAEHPTWIASAMDLRDFGLVLLFFIFICRISC